MEDASGSGDTYENIATESHIGWVVKIGVKVGQVVAVAECHVADGGDRVGDGHRGQAATSEECALADGGDGVGDGHRSQAAAA